MLTQERLATHIEMLLEAKSYGRKKSYILDDCNVGRNFLINIRNGHSPTLDKLIAIANYLDMSIDQLVGRDPVPPPVILENVYDETIMGLCNDFSSLNYNGKKAVLLTIINEQTKMEQAKIEETKIEEAKMENRIRRRRTVQEKVTSYESCDFAIDEE